MTPTWGQLWRRLVALWMAWRTPEAVPCRDCGMPLIEGEREDHPLSEELCFDCRGTAKTWRPAPKWGDLLDRAVAEKERARPQREVVFAPDVGVGAGRSDEEMAESLALGRLLRGVKWYDPSELATPPCDRRYTPEP